MDTAWKRARAVFSTGRFEQKTKLVVCFCTCRHREVPQVRKTREQRKLGFTGILLHRLLERSDGHGAHGGVILRKCVPELLGRRMIVGQDRFAQGKPGGSNRSQRGTFGYRVGRRVATL